jgi:hypothetical protein
MIPNWHRLALRGANREAAARRYFRRIYDMGLENYGAYLRRNKRKRHLDRDYQRLRLLSAVDAHERGVSAEQWQDVYYGELERLGERAPQDVRARWSGRA